MDSVIVDMPTDWLYKGKKRQAKARPGGTASSAASSAASAAPSAIPSAATGNGDSTAGPVSVEAAVIGTADEASNATSAGGDMGSESTPLRKRSVSISNGALSKATVSPAAAAKTPTSNGDVAQTPSQAIGAPKTRLARSSSISSSDLKRSESLNERSKKSLFGSLFGKKSSSSSSSPQEAQPHQHQHHQSSGHVHHSVAANILAPIVSNSVMKEPMSPEVRPQTPVSHPESFQLHKPSKTISFEELAKLSLKRVTFAVDKFGSDPPQQLPSRKPKIGNVLVPDDMISDLPPISLGITNGSPQQQQQQQAAAASPQAPLKEPMFTKDSREYKIAVDGHRRALKESIKHQQEAHYAAIRIENEVASFKANVSLGESHSSKSANPVEQETGATKVDDKIANLSIDKPIHMHENHFSLDPTESTEMDQAEITLDVIYTRCCHLREILPIPSTLRQVKGKTAPLHMLKFLNPKPTLIDILSFSDFISIVPISVVIFDKVSLTPEMFKIVLMSLSKSQGLDKLSLRNVPIYQEGWKQLCKFLLINESITRLDISQTKTRPDLPETLHRDNMDWSLFSQVLSKRTGKPLEELLLNGIKFSKLPVEQFDNLITSFGEKNLTAGLRLGVATSDINVDCLKVLLNWASKYKVQGVDLAFNDLSELVKPMVSKLSALSFADLEYFTLNSTNIPSAYDLALILKYLSTLPSLKFLDLSSLPQDFPDVLPYMFKYLPRFPKLNRIHLDNNSLSFKNLAMVCSILAKCRHLTHISIQSPAPIYDIINANKVIHTPEDVDQFKRFSRNTFSASLYALVKDSPNLVILDVDYDDVTDDIKSRIALTLMRNMNKNIDSNFQNDELSTQDELIFDGSLMTETAEEVLKRLNNKEMLKTDPTKRYLTKKYCEKLQKLQLKVQFKIDDMFEKRSSGELPMQEKENLLRLLLLEKNLSNILEIFSDIPHISQIFGPGSDNLPFLKHVSSETTLSTPSSADHEIAARPHLMATDSGHVIDVITGKSLLVDPVSNTSRVGSRIQEEEEGELHKWGFFVQQQRSIYPEHEARIPSAHVAQSRSTTVGSSNTVADGKISQPIILPKIPSGTELREAIIQAKGIDSIDDLIKNVNKEQVELESIYGNSLRSSGSMTEHSIDSKGTSNASSVETATSSGATNQESNPNEKDNQDKTVKETYDKLLNNLKMERPIKTEGQAKLK